MPKFSCLYCKTNLTHDSLSVRKKHFDGRKHKQHVADYWAQVAKELGRVPGNRQHGHHHNGNYRQLSRDFEGGSQPLNPLDQTLELRVFKIPGLDKNAESTLDNAVLPPPANIASNSFPRQVI